MAGSFRPQKVFDKTLSAKDLKKETHETDFYKQDEPPVLTAKSQLIHWYFLAGYYALIIPFKIRKTDDGIGWQTDIWIFQKILCLLIWWPISWLFSLSELVSRIVMLSSYTDYRPDHYFDLVYFILHPTLQATFCWVVMTKRIKLQSLFNDVSAFSLFNPTESTVPLSSGISKWKTRILHAYMFYMHIVCIAFVILREIYFGTTLRMILPISEQFAVAIETGRKRFFLADVDRNHTAAVQPVNGTDMPYDMYTSENIIIGSIELTLLFIRLWNDCLVFTFFYGALPVTFWFAGKQFQCFLNGIYSSRNGSEFSDKAFNLTKADLIVKKFRELNNIVASLNSLWSTATFIYVVEMSLTMVICISAAVKSKNTIMLLYIGHLTVFLVVSLVLLAEGHRTNAYFKQWLCDWNIRKHVFAQRKSELEWLERNLEVSKLGIGSVGAYEISYGFLAQMLLFTATVFIITF
ncbi:unnamed protein product [Orchesella dallaii]|uniref:Gustatory receptor n=1 Tax=Orchesella dallaii TaxID=48710 RepID=A0ABP1RP32_9HEXA